MGPRLLNIFYDEVLILKIPGVTLISFADYLLLVVIAESSSELERLANKAFKEVDKWISDYKLELTLQKTEVIILYGPKTREGIKVKIRDFDQN